MCLIIHRPKSFTKLNRDMLYSAFKNNNDGWGIMYHNGTQIKVEKGFDYEVCEKYIEYLEGFDTEFVVHLRMRTHGSLELDNVHPFSIGQSGAYLVHNGVISGLTAYAKEKSDTAILADMLSNLVNKFGLDILKDKSIQQFIDATVTSDRVLIMMPDGEIIKLGQGIWNELDGCALSNTYAWSITKPKLLSPSSIPERIPSTSLTVAYPNKTTKNFPTSEDELIDWEEGDIEDSLSNSYGLNTHLSEFFLPFNGTEYQVEEYLNCSQVYSTELNDEYTTLQDLQMLDPYQLEEVIWANPDIAVRILGDLLMHSFI